MILEVFIKKSPLDPFQGKVSSSSLELVGGKTDACLPH